MILLCGNEVGVMALRYFWKIESVICYCEKTRKTADAFNFKQLKDLSGIKDKTILSVHGRDIVPKVVLEKNQCFNIHPYLYCYKGADPIGRAIKEGNFNASVGLHKMTDKVDEGPLVCEVFKQIVLSKSKEAVYKQLYPLYTACFKVFECVSS